MPASMTEEEAAARRSRILNAARWCFLNFGFSKTSFEDIAKRANISRTLLYRIFKDKEDVFTAVFADWLVARYPAAQQAATGPGKAKERLLNVCKVMVLEPWSDMVGAPMGAEFYDVCERLDPKIAAQHRKVALRCVAAVLGDEDTAEVFLLALDGLLADEPTTAVLEYRMRILVDRFARTGKRRRRPEEKGN
ncbi:TetR/AcrR family transcriptional regulator [Pendulispora brunnea]|uniref:TetR/AcrR family transcriptional regulator n=1 Tax=Pendulispora brunnea TaxID=2905690 RepID=A0ABZ2KCF8_9BACT